MNKHLSIVQKYSLLLESSREMIIFFNKNGVIIDCNKTAKDILGYDDIYKISVMNIFKGVATLQNNFLVVDSKYDNKSGEAIAYRKDQTCMPVDLKIITYKEQKKFIGLCMAANKTEVKKLIGIIKSLKEEIKNLIDIKNRFVANITHELRTPVSGILGMTETLLDMELNPKQKDNVDIIYQCCNNMNNLINNLLDIARMKCNKLMLEEQTFDFRRMIDNTIKLNMKQVNEKRLKLIVNVAKDIPDIVMGDEYRLAQIINNLISNAVKFTNKGEIILDVSITEHNRNDVELFFMIIDTGIGISADKMDKIFVSFYQVDSSITRRFGGIGLGLSISRTLVKAMGGKIKAESEEHKGSTFSFTVRLRIPNSNDGIQNTYIPNTDSNGITIQETYMNTEDEYNKIFPDDTMLLTDIESDEDNKNIICLNSATAYSTQYAQLIMEKLILTIELKGWHHAEQLALLVRDMISKEDKFISNKALQLLFGIRKEDYDMSIKRARELENMLKEEEK